MASLSKDYSCIFTRPEGGKFIARFLADTPGEAREIARYRGQKRGYEFVRMQCKKGGRRYHKPPPVLNRFIPLSDD